ncbi:MAG TPA: PepSY-like domain-containing protein [Chitinophagaceae bacterium]|nr:PepSY-like domain-containing protein [Chitinophagaceae bacterium]
MKKLFFFLTIAFLSTAVFSQDVPQNVVAAFHTKYPGTNIKKWKSTKDGFTADFKQDNNKYTAFFSSNGEWQRTEQKIKWTWNLPADVNKAFKTGKYAAWYVEKISYVETPAQHSYVLRINNKALLPSQEISVFRETRLLYYDKNGELVTNEKL